MRSPCRKIGGFDNMPSMEVPTPTHLYNKSTISLFVHVRTVRSWRDSHNLKRIIKIIITNYIKNAHYAYYVSLHKTRLSTRLFDHMNKIEEKA